MRLSGAKVELVDAAAVDDVRIVRIGRDHVALAARGDLAEFAHRDAVEIAGAARQRRGARILLRAVDAVRKTVVRADVVDLRGRLVVPRAPGLAAVQRDDRALVDAEDLPVRVVRIDPELVEIIARVVAFQRDEMRAAVVRAQHDRVHRVDAVRVRRIDRDAAEIPAALPDAIVLADVLPARAGVVGTVEPADVVRHREVVDDRVDALRIALARPRCRCGRPCPESHCGSSASRCRRRRWICTSRCRARSPADRCSTACAAPATSRRRSCADCRARTQDRSRRSHRRCRARAATIAPPSRERNTPRSAFGPYGWPSAATKSAFASFGSTMILPICWLSARPMCVQLLPASLDLYMPSPCEMSERMSASPVPT